MATSPPSSASSRWSPRWPRRVLAVLRLRARRGIATATQRATYEVLHTAGLAAEPLRAGLTAAGAAKAVRHLRALVGAAGLALDRRRRAARLRRARRRTTASSCSRRPGGRSTTGRSTVLGEPRPALRPGRLPGPRARSWRRCRAGRPGGRALVAVADGPPAPGLVQATLETARWAGNQLALAELDSSRERLARAEVRALRAQISPHFIYNALTAIALVRPHRPGAGPGADPGVRRVHPVLVPGARRVHHAGRGAALDRPLPDHRAGPVRRPAAGAAADRPRGAAGRPAVPLPAAAGGERGPARVVPQARRRHGEHRGPGRGRRVPHHGRGRRGGDGSGRADRGIAELAAPDDPATTPASTSA